MKTIEITVSPKGETQVETKGFAGNECRDASKFIESALGKSVGETLKPEFYVQNYNQNSVDNTN